MCAATDELLMMDELRARVRAGGGRVVARGGVTARQEAVCGGAEGRLYVRCFLRCGAACLMPYRTESKLSENARWIALPVTFVTPPGRPVPPPALLNMLATPASAGVGVWG